MVLKWYFKGTSNLRFKVVSGSIWLTVETQIKRRYYNLKNYSGEKWKLNIATETLTTEALV